MLFLQAHHSSPKATRTVPKATGDVLGTLSRENADSPSQKLTKPRPDSDAGLLAGIQTGDDVVAFYGKYGQDSAIKFFYCVRSAVSRTSPPSWTAYQN